MAKAFKTLTDLTTSERNILDFADDQLGCANAEHDRWMDRTLTTARCFVKARTEGERLALLADIVNDATLTARATEALRAKHDQRALVLQALGLDPAEHPPLRALRGVR